MKFKKVHLNFGSKDSGISWNYPELYADNYLRELISIDSFVSNIDDAQPDMSTACTLCNYVSKLWVHDGKNVPDKADPLYILTEVKRGKRFRCVEYSILLNGFLKALGIPSRVVSLKTSDAQTRKTGAGHVVVEFFCRSFKKWILADPQVSFIPIFENTPLNAVELQNHITENKNILNAIYTYTEAKEPDVMSSNYEYFEFVYQYLYYFSFLIDYHNNKDITHLMLMPKEACLPVVFQITNKITGHIGTNSLSEFYKVPNLK
ncbi:MAG: transglutaminase domain-containing protein [Ignavibacteria bacterium]|nr:transglutaminase domain-containing protein [Ignavibacteria bacterium]